MLRGNVSKSGYKKGWRKRQQYDKGEAIGWSLRQQKDVTELLSVYSCNDKVKGFNFLLTMDGTCGL